MANSSFSGTLGPVGPTGPTGPVGATGATGATGAGGGSYALISDQLVTTGGGVATVTFTSIGGYKHLKLFAAVKSQTGAAGDGMLIQFNSDTNVADYFTQLLSASATTTSANELIGATLAGYIAHCCGGTSGAGRFSQHEITLLNYLDVTYSDRTCHQQGFAPTGVASGTLDANIFGLLWLSSSAITQIDVKPSSGANWAVGSRFTLYGLS